MAKKRLDKVIDISKVIDVIKALLQGIIILVNSVYAWKCGLNDSQKDLNDSQKDNSYLSL